MDSKEFLDALNLIASRQEIQALLDAPESAP